VIWPEKSYFDPDSGGEAGFMGRTWNAKDKDPRG
jgi:hypothetical protein